jgi:hypothetical protein
MQMAVLPNGDVVFVGSNGGLWVTDGTGTHLLRNFAVDTGHGVVYFTPSDLTVFNGEVLFNVEGGLWVTDGTAAGTHELMGVTGYQANQFDPAQPIPINLDPSDLTVFNHEVLFAGTDGNDFRGLWVSDGFETHELTGIANASSSGINPSDLIVSNGEVLFNGTDSSGQTGSWATDGTAAGTHELAPVAPVAPVTPDEAEIARLYYGLLNRAPDPGGLQAWTNALENGASLPQITQSFLGSAEYETTSIGQSNALFVQYLYSTALDRSPDGPGFQGWESALNTGTLSRADVVNGVLASSEFQSDFAGQSDATYINEVYEVALQRPAEPLALQAWGAALSNGMSRTTFDQLVAGSPEFQSSITELAASSFVGTLYEQALGRAPDPGGLQSWTSALVTRNLNNVGVAIGIAESPEAQHFLSPLIDHLGI